MTQNPDIEYAAIRQLQRYLRQLSYFNDTIPPAPVTGRWDPHTEQALLAFQREYQLPPTGVADQATWELLYSEYLKSLSERSAPEKMPIFPRLPEKHELMIGDVGFVVVAVQYMLDELTLHFEGLEEIPQTGIYDTQTAEAVSHFQKRHLLPPTGRVDKTTWDALVKAYELLMSDTQQ